MIMGLIMLPFFMPLLLIGWLVEPREERELRGHEARQERLFGETWAVLFGRETT